MTVQPSASDAFRRWFGGSKVVDSSGNPLVVYHGTRESFDAFEVGRVTKNFCTFGEYETRRHGVFFAADKGFAQTFAGKGGTVISVYLSIQNQFDLTEGYPNDFYTKHGEMLTRNNLHFMRPEDMWELFDDGFPGSEEFVAAVKADGFDGVKTVERNEAGELHEVYVAFDPEQIQLANYNSGTFELNDDRDADLDDDQGDRVGYKL